LPVLEEGKLINFRLELIRQAMANEDLPKQIKSGKSVLEKIRKEMPPVAKRMKKERTRAQKAIRTPIVKRKPKKRTKYNTQELFEKLAKAHQKIADSLKNQKNQSAKRRYHKKLAEAYAFVANRGRDEENDNLTRLPPMFKGALIITPAQPHPRYY